jgi:hypothetical protein
MSNRSRLHKPAALASLNLLLAATLLAPALTGCRDSAPEDLIQQEPTTDALVFVKTQDSETLNRTWAAGN